MVDTTRAEAPELSQALDAILDFPITANGCVWALSDFADAVTAAVREGKINGRESAVLIAEIRRRIPEAVLRCMALAQADQPDASREALRSDPFDEQEGRELMEAILLTMGMLNNLTPEKLSRIIAQLAAQDVPADLVAGL